VDALQAGSGSSRSAGERNRFFGKGFADSPTTLHCFRVSLALSSMPGRTHTQFENHLRADYGSGDDVVEVENSPETASLASLQ